MDHVRPCAVILRGKVGKVKKCRKTKIVGKVEKCRKVPITGKRSFDESKLVDRSKKKGNQRHPESACAQQYPVSFRLSGQARWKLTYSQCAQAIISLPVPANSGFAASAHFP
jgi:hypothetical protein